MLIAKLKKETNIVEYLIYMFQIEDIIRSFDFDIQKIDSAIVSKFEQTDEIKAQIRTWYQDLINKMKSEEVQTTGHLNELKEIIKGLDVLHQTLLTTIQDKEYQELYEIAKSALAELVRKSGGKQHDSEIEIALNGIYGLLVLRLRQQNVASSTEEELGKVSALLARLAHQYQQMKMGKLSLSEEKYN